MSDRAAHEDYQIRELEAEDIPQVKRFLADCFPPKGVQNIPGWLEWQLDHPLGACIPLLFHGDRLAGWSVFLQVRIVGDGRTHSGAFATNTMVHPDFRRRGLGTLLHQHRVERFDFALSCGQSAANLALYTKLGFPVISDYRRCTIVRGFPRPYRKREYVRELLSWLNWRARGRPPDGGGRLRIVDEAAEVPASWFENRAPPGTLFFLHSPEYLDWRYRRHPHLPYRFAMIEDDDRPLGVAPIRREGDTTWIAELFCECSDMNRCVRILAGHLPGHRSMSVFTGRSTARAFEINGGYVDSLGHDDGTEFMGYSEDPQLQHLLSRDWAIWLGDADKER